MALDPILDSWSFLSLLLLLLVFFFNGELTFNSFCDTEDSMILLFSNVSCLRFFCCHL